MALPSSGQLRASSINSELGRTSTSTLSIDTAENGGYGAINPFSSSRPNSANPAAYSEWYSYDHSAGGGPDLFPLPEIGYDASNRDQACRNAALGRFVEIWGDGPSLVDCTLIYSNATGTRFPRAGWYAENWSGNERYWNGSSFTTNAACRI